MLTEAEAYRQRWWNHEIGWASPAHQLHYIDLLLRKAQCEATDYIQRCTSSESTN